MPLRLESRPYCKPWPIQLANHSMLLNYLEDIYYHSIIDTRICTIPSAAIISPVQKGCYIEEMLIDFPYTPLLLHNSQEQQQLSGFSQL